MFTRDSRDPAGMSYLLYGNRRSGSCMVELALSEIGAAYRRHDVDLESGQQFTGDYQAVNAQKKLPALMTAQGEVLTESGAILLTLDERHSEAGLMPAPASADRARAMRWLLFVVAEVYPIVEIIDYPERFAAPGATDIDGIRETAQLTWRRRWRIVETELTDGPYLLGDRLTLADFAIAVVSRWGRQEDWRPRHLPKIERLTRAVGARERCSAVWDRHFELP